MSAFITRNPAAKNPDTALAILISLKEWLSSGPVNFFFFVIYST